MVYKCWNGFKSLYSILSNEIKKVISAFTRRVRLSIPVYFPQMIEKSWLNSCHNSAVLVAKIYLAYCACARSKIKFKVQKGRSKKYLIISLLCNFYTTGEVGWFSKQIQFEWKITQLNFHHIIVLHNKVRLYLTKCMYYFSALICALWI